MGGLKYVSNSKNCKSVQNSWLFRSFEFENGSRMSDKKLVIFEFKYFQNKKGYKQAVKSTRIKQNYCIEHTVFISFR